MNIVDRIISLSNQADNSAWTELLYDAYSSNNCPDYNRIYDDIGTMTKAGFMSKYAAQYTYGNTSQADFYDLARGRWEICKSAQSKLDSLREALAEISP